MPFPTGIRIGGRRWGIKKRSGEVMGAVGLCHYSSARLEVATKQTPFDTRDTLLHETLHAILAMQGRTTFGNEEEELYVRALSTGLLAVLQDNPEFAQWLIEPVIK